MLRACGGHRSLALPTLSCTLSLPFWSAGGASCRGLSTSSMRYPQDAAFKPRLGCGLGSGGAKALSSTYLNVTQPMRFQSTSSSTTPVSVPTANNQPAEPVAEQKPTQSQVSDSTTGPSSVAEKHQQQEEGTTMSSAASTSEENKDAKQTTKALPDKKGGSKMFRMIKQYGVVMLVWWTIVDVVMMAGMVGALQYEYFPYDAVFLVHALGLSYDLESEEPWVINGREIPLTPRLLANGAVSYAVLELATPVVLPVVFATLPFFLRVIGRSPVAKAAV